jgi:electron transfer flavoprotein beta subunit
MKITHRGVKVNVIVCYKMAPDAEDIQVNPDGTISLDMAEWKISQYDRQAIEIGVQIIEACGGKVSALSVGSQKLNNSKFKKDILSRGPDELHLVMDDRLDNADSHYTAQVLAATIREMGDFDLILCGEGSADLYAQQVGIQLGELLGVPVTNAVSKIEVMDGPNLQIERNLEDEIEVLKISLPVVLAVTPDIAEPRVASMKMILAAGKKPVTEWGLDNLSELEIAGNTRNVLNTLAPKKVDRKGILFKGSAAEVTQQLVTALSKEGVL